HTSSCTAPSPRQSCSPPSEYAPQACCVAFPACQPTHPRLSVSESRSILPRSQPKAPSSASQSNSRTDCLVTVGKRRWSCLQQISHAKYQDLLIQSPVYRYDGSTTTRSSLRETSFSDDCEDPRFSRQAERVGIARTYVIRMRGPAGMI